MYFILLIYSTYVVGHADKYTLVSVLSISAFLTHIIKTNSSQVQYKTHLCFSRPLNFLNVVLDNPTGFTNINQLHNSVI